MSTGKTRATRHSHRPMGARFNAAEARGRGASVSTASVDARDTVEMSLRDRVGGRRTAALRGRHRFNLYN